MGVSLVFSLPPHICDCPLGVYVNQVPLRGLFSLFYLHLPGGGVRACWVEASPKQGEEGCPQDPTNRLQSTFCFFVWPTGQRTRFVQVVPRLVGQGQYGVHGDGSVGGSVW